MVDRLGTSPRVTLLTKAGLVDTLTGPGPFTVFAPTDEAFAKVPAVTLESLGKDPAALKKVLTYHVARARCWPPMSSQARWRPSRVRT